VLSFRASSGSVGACEVIGGITKLLGDTVNLVFTFPRSKMSQAWASTGSTGAPELGELLGPRREALM
jgi:hypothetical protein